MNSDQVNGVRDTHDRDRGDRRVGRESASERRQPSACTFRIRTADEGYELGLLRAQLFAFGWLEVSRGADVTFIDGREGRSIPTRGGPSYRILIAGADDDVAPPLVSGCVDDVLELGDPHALRVRLLVAGRALESRRRAASQVAQARRWSETDGLTGLGNRHAMGPALARMLRRVAAGDGGAVLIADIDHFKSVNDRLGHLTGDRLLSQTATAIASVLRDDRDQAFRFGGEEFVVVLPGASEAAAVSVAERLRAAVGALSVGRGEMPVTISVGLVAIPAAAAVTAEPVLRAADKALYAAKTGGRDRVYVGQLEVTAAIGQGDDLAA